MVVATRPNVLSYSWLCLICLISVIPTNFAWSGSSLLLNQRLLGTSPSITTVRPPVTCESQRVKLQHSTCRNSLSLRMGASKRLSDAEAMLLDDLLCQRAVQNQLYYFQEFRDGFKRQWLEHFLGHEGLYNFHGFGGLQCPAAEYLQTMMSSPPESHEIKMSWGNRYTGGSKDNPYLQNRERFETYEETVHPQKICKGIMDIREQIALEWIEDIEFVKTEDSIFWFDLDVAHEQALKRPKNNLNPEEEEEEGMTERETLFGVGISGNYKATPLRKRTYDVLKKACSWVAVQKTMQRFRDDGDDAEDWFRTLWETEWKEAMETSGRHGVADDFLRTLVQMPSRAATGKEEGTLRMINPEDIARALIDERQAVLEGWKAWLESGQYKERHTEIQRELLMRSMDEFSGRSEMAD